MISNLVDTVNLMSKWTNMTEYQRSRSFIDLGPRSFRFTIFKLLFLRNLWADWSHIPCGSSMGWGNERLRKWTRSHDQDGRHAHIWYKHDKFFFSGTKRPMTLKVDMQHWVLEYYQVCSNDDSGLTLTYFMARSNSGPYAFMWEEGKTMDFSETIVVYDIKVGWGSQLN